MDFFPEEIHIPTTVTKMSLKNVYRSLESTLEFVRFVGSRQKASSIKKLFSSTFLFIAYYKLAVYAVD